MSKLGVRKQGVCLTVIALLVFSFSVGLVDAQYVTGAKVDVIIPSSGVFSANSATVGVLLELKGVPGATGSVTFTSYPDNPQPTANVPAGIGLARFLVVVFDIDAGDFEEAKLVVSYTDADVQALEEPYTVFKYVAETNEFVEFPAVVNTEAKTVTITLTDVADPLFAIGGASVAGSITASLWIAIVAAVIIVVLVVVLVLKRFVLPRM
jgi:hypothetical protein